MCRVGPGWGCGSARPSSGWACWRWPSWPTSSGAPRSTRSRHRPTWAPNSCTSRTTLSRPNLPSRTARPTGPGGRRHQGGPDRSRPALGQPVGRARHPQDRPPRHSIVEGVGRGPAPAGARVTTPAHALPGERRATWPSPGTARPMPTPSTTSMPSPPVTAFLHPSPHCCLVPFTTVNGTQVVAPTDVAGARLHAGRRSRSRSRRATPLQRRHPPPRGDPTFDGSPTPGDAGRPRRNGKTPDDHTGRRHR